MEIAVTDATGYGLDKHFTLTWLVDLDLLDGEGLIDFSKNCGSDSHNRLLRRKLSLYIH
jgi:hypothetical protein